jgi:hypothetical protein
MSQSGRQREIEVAETTTVAELEPLVDLSARQLIDAAFHDLGLLLTIHEPLEFEQSKVLLAKFGYVARRASPPPRA